MNIWNNGIVLFSLSAVCLCTILQPSAVISADDSEWGRDPFAYKSKSNAYEGKSKLNTAPVDKVSATAGFKKPEMKVKGIFTGPEDHLIAIVDDKEYVTGDHIGSAVIKDIDQFGVVLVEDGITRRIGLFGPNVEWGKYDD